MGKTWNDRIIDEAIRSIRYAISILGEIEAEGNEKLEKLVRNTIQYFDDKQVILNELRENEAHYRSISSTKESDDDTIHLQKVHRLVSYPNEVSRIMNLIHLWITEITNSSMRTEMAFAEHITKSLLERADSKTKPIAIFGNRFAVIHMQEISIIEIPISLAKAYHRWVGIGHEIGHIFVKLRKEQYTSLIILLMQTASQRQNEDEVISKLILNWILNWSNELASDFVGMALCGPSYVSEVIYHSYSPLPTGVVETHPPAGFRVSCMLEAAKRLGQDFRGLEDTAPTNLPIFAELDPRQRELLDEKLVPRFVNWLLEQDFANHLEVDWNQHWLAVDALMAGKWPEASFVILFNALSHLSMIMNVDKKFMKLKNELVG